MLDALKNHLSTRWAGRGEIAYEHQMASTNLAAKAMARNGAAHGSLAVCDHQTAGRGRLQRSWDTPDGEALTQSLVLRPRLPMEQAQLCTFASALAAAKAIEQVCPGLKPGIKWPNDVVIGSRKCVGILCEMVLEADGYAVIAGVGINVNQRGFEGELRDKATSLFLETGQTVDRGLLLCAYLEQMEQAVDTLERDGLEEFLTEYVNRSVTLGRRVHVSGTGIDFVGTARAVDETGALIVTDESGADRRVLSADVSVRGLMGYVDEGGLAHEAASL